MVNDFTDSLRLFLQGFSARDLAEPLPSFDDTASVDTVREAVCKQQIEVFGIRQGGIVCGWMFREDIAQAQNPLVGRPIEASTVIADTASLNDVIQGLSTAPCLFVRSIGQVCGLIRQGDIQKPAMRMWLFGLVTISELRVTRMIDESYPDDAWQKFLSPGRLQKAQGLRQERRRRGQERRLLDCLQFADKGRIVARDELLRSQSRFASRREVEDFVKALEDLRNNLAHAQDLSGDWDVIRNLTENLHHIVLGRADASSRSSEASAVGLPVGKIVS